MKIVQVKDDRNNNIERKRKSLQGVANSYKKKKLIIVYFLKIKSRSVKINLSYLSFIMPDFFYRIRQ